MAATVATAAGACRINCRLQLECGHLCGGECGKCWAPVAAGGPAPVHELCTAVCKRINRECGHACGVKHGCSDPAGCPPCEERCALFCPHGGCGQACHKICTPCAEPCLWVCEHARCTARCGQPCTRAPCDEPCARPNPLGCGHPCLGACGENCPELCAVCARAGAGGGAPADWVEPFSRFELANMEAGTRLVSLACGHIMDVDSLDDYLRTMDPIVRRAASVKAAAEAAAAGESAAVTGVMLEMPTCPECRRPLEGPHRIRNIVRRCQAEVDDVKRLRGLDEIVAAAAVLRGIPPPGPSEAVLTMLQNRAKEILEHLGGQQPPRTPHARAAHRVKACYVLAAVAAARGPPPIAAAAADRLVAEPINANDAGSARILVDAAMEAAELALQTLGKEAGRSRAMDRWRVAAQIARSLGDEDLVRNVNRVQDGNASNWACAAIVAEVGPGHAFKCVNGHVYFIGDCGGAMETSHCPDCSARIGGSDHQRLAGNEAAPEVDNSHYMPNGAYAHGANGLEDALRLLGPGWG